MGLLDHISGSLEKEIEKQKLLAYNIENLDEILKTINTSVKVQTIKIDESGGVTQTSTGISMALAYISGFLMYMLVFMFGSMVMRGVIEEKTSRIVEVIISSVKPVQLMLGKIIGVALVGLTQFGLWIILTLAIVMIVKANVLPEGTMEQIQQLPQSLAEADQSVAGDRSHNHISGTAHRVPVDVCRCAEPAMGADHFQFHLLFHHRIPALCLALCGYRIGR